MQSTVSRALASTLHTHLFPHSTLTVQLTVLAADGSLLAALLNAAGLACVDAGVPMTDYLCACTAGSTSAFAAADDAGTTGGADPLLDLSLQEETELPGLTAATLGSRGDKVVVLVCESRVRVERLEGMLAVAVDGCKQVRELLDTVVRETAGASGEGEGGVGLDDGGMDLDR